MYGGDAPFTKMARYVAHDNLWVTDWPRPDARMCWVVAYEADVSGNPWWGFQIAKPNPNANFPYGLDVVPDH